MNMKKAHDRPDRASLELLYSISKELNKHLDLGLLITRILDLTATAVGALSGSIIVLDRQERIIEGALVYEGIVTGSAGEQLQHMLEGGLAGWVVRERQAVLIDNTHQDKRWRRSKNAEVDRVPRSVLSVPLIAREEIVGVLTLVHPQEGNFSNEHLALLTAIADQAGMAVDNARLYKAEQDRTRFSNTLQEIARCINAELDTRHVFDEILKQLYRVIQFDSASILVLDAENLRLVATRGFRDTQIIEQLKIPVDPDILSGRVLALRKPILVEDVQQHPGWVWDVDIPEAKLIHAWIGVPLIVRDQAVGVLTIDSHEIGFFGEDEVDLLTAFAEQAAIAVANAQIYAENQRQLCALEEFADAAIVLTASLDLDEVLQRIIAQTLNSLDIEAVSLALRDKHTNELVFRAASGKGSEGIVGLRLEHGAGIAGWVAEHGKPVIIPDVRTDPMHYKAIDEQTGFETRSVICVPIMVHAESIGALEAINPSRGEFLSHEVDLLNGIASLAGTAISHARLFSETRAAQRRYASLFEGNVDPILISDMTGEVVEANQCALDFLGISLRDLVGKHLPDLLTGEDKEFGVDICQIQSGETISLEANTVCEDNQSIPVKIFITCVDLDQESVLQWIIRDISERRALDELRNDLISMIFHDLRSPLGNIISSLQVLETTLPMTDETVRTVVSIANRSSRRLSHLLDSLLDLSSLEIGQAVLMRTSTSIEDVIREAVEEITPLAEAKQHQVTIQLPNVRLPEIKIDIDMIRRVLINLLNNAVKYSVSGSTIKILASLNTDAQTVVVQVHDQGPGIRKRDQKIIFDKFTRVRRSHTIKGLGLGLAFCRLAIEAHGGEIWVESEIRKGSTFFFSLPV